MSAILLVTSCQKALDTKDITPGADGTITLKVNASLPDYDNSTKGSLVNTVRLAWADGDEVFVYDNEKCLGTLTAALEEGSDKYAVLSGTISNTAADKLTLVAASEEMTPSVTAQDDPIPEGITFDLAAQDRTGAPYVAYAIINKPASTDASGIKTAFQLATSVIKVNCTGTKAGTPVTQVRIKGVNTSLNLVPSADGEPAVNSTAGTGMITRTNASSFTAASGEGIMSFSVAVIEQNATSDRKIYVSQAGHPGSASFSAAALTKGLSYNTVAQICGPYKTVGGHSGVQLWEDGPYWATCNMGAKSPTDFGYYYTWGSLQAYEYRDDCFYKAGTNTQIGTDGFSWTNYTKFGTHNDSYPDYGISKYNSSGPVQLELVDDAATIEWGSGWRMPDGGNNGEFSGLASKCTATWIQDGDKAGTLFTGKDDYAGISVFFPAAGYGSAEKLLSAGNRGDYWSRTLHTSTVAAHSLYFAYYKTSEFSYDSRYYGLTIRPVID